MILVRRIAAVIIPAIVGAALLALIAPWLSSCIGASRCTDCVDPSSSADPDNPELWCYWGVCDFFLSATDVAMRVGVVLVVLIVAGWFATKAEPRRQLVRGI